MKVHIDRRVADYAGSGVVMIVMLVGAMALSSLPSLVQVLSRPHAPTAVAQQTP